MIELLTIWDFSADPCGQEGHIYRWDGYAEKDSIHSLLRYVDIHGERLRRKYLAWIHDVGESRIENKRLIDHLAFEDGLSYWWMTLFAEQSPWKQPTIVDAIRIFALEEIISQQKPRKFRLVSANRALHEVIKDLCRSLGVSYDWERVPERSRVLRQSTIRRIYCALPYSVRALVSLVSYIRVRWPFRQAEKSGWIGGDQSLFICSYFLNVVSTPGDERRFHSRYWEGLHGLMAEMGLSGNWLQLYCPHDAVASPLVAMNWVQRFNRQHKERSFHAFLDAYLSWRIVFHVLNRWLRLLFISWDLRNIRHVFSPQGSRFSLWPLMRNDWLASMCGPNAITNLLWIELLDRALRALPYQKKGLYLYEGQAWERALIHAWRKHRHGQLIAVAHSTVRFWDLRYFTDSRTVRSSDPYAMLRPDVIALNGKASVDAYLSLDYPKEAIVECEALRYGYLNELHAGRVLIKRNKGTVNVLILGGAIRSGTIKMLRLLEASLIHMDISVTYTLKSHPSLIIEAEDYPSLHLQIVLDPLSSIVQNYDIIFAENLTSAAVDAYLAGLPVVVMLDETELNFSPLRGYPGVIFISTANELAEALQHGEQSKAGGFGNNEFFFLDPELPRWRNLLLSAVPT